jgi:hypothetical protein
MATPRSRHIRISDLVLNEDWDDATLATMVRLLAWMRQRWARERLTAEQACDALLSARDAMLITRTHRPHIAFERLLSLPLAARLGSLAVALVESQGHACLSLKWPKAAIYQGWDARDSGRDRPAERPLRRPVARRPEKEEEHPASQGDAAKDAASLETALRLLSREPGSPDAKRAWLARELPLLLAEAERQEPDNPTARSAAFRSLMLRYYRQHLKPQPLRNAHGSPNQGRSTSDLAERARQYVARRNAELAARDGSG